MGRFCTQSLLAMVLLSAGVLFAQEASLGDVGRQQRSKQKAKLARTAAKLVTDDDMPKRSDAPMESDKAKEDEKDERAPNRDSRESSPAPNSQSAEYWKAQILMQKRSVSAQQEQVNQFRESIHFVEANRYVNGAQYNEQQRRRQIQLDQMEKQLEQQKKRLADMQDSARKAGFGNSVYDPNN
jgi:hypothetical protein